MELRGGQNVGNGTHTMEQHGDELNEDDGEEKEHEDNTNRLQMQVLFGDDNLKSIIVIIYFDFKQRSKLAKM